MVKVGWGEDVVKNMVPSQYERLIENMPMGMLHYRLENGTRLILQAFNPAAERILGIDLTPRLNKLIEEAFPGLRGSPIPGHYVRVAQGFEPWTSEEVFYDRDGISGAFSVVAFQPAQGEVAVLFADITERKHWEKAVVEKEEAVREAEAALRISESRFHAVFNHISSGVAIYRYRGPGRSDFVFQDLNPAGEKLVGRPAEEVRGKLLPEVLPDLGGLGFYEVFERVSKTGKSERLPVRVRQGGEIEYAIENYISLLPSGELLVVFDDITDRIRGEEDLKASEQRFRTIADYTADWEYWQSPSGDFVYMSPSCQRITGYPRQSFYNEPELLDRIVCEEDLPLWKDHVRSELSRESTTRLLFRILTEEGTTRWIEHSCREVFDARRRPAGRRASNRDVTERVEAEEAQRRLEEQLLQAQKMEAIGQLAGGVAHDFNNLLQVITGYTALALEELPQGHTAEVESCMGRISQATDRARDLIRQLMTFSRHQESRLEVVDPNRVVNGLMEMIGRVLPESVELRFTPGSPLDPVLVDVGQLEQVLLNLCVNAKDAMPRGGVLEIRSGNASFPKSDEQQRHWPREGTYSYVEVSDNGHGMTPEVRDRIFEPFFTTKNLGEGTGLGLSTVYGIVRQHNGMVAVDSSPGSGSTFRVYLPSCRPDRARKPARAKSSPARGLGEMILVAEDDETVRSLAETILKRNGYRVITARNGDEAILLFRKHQPEIDLVLSDVVMPGQSGRTVLNVVQAMSPGLPVILATGYSFNMLEEAGSAPDYDLIQKPFDKDELLHRVRSSLDRARARG